MKKKEIFIFIGTKEDLLNNYFDDDGIRGDFMGWAHRVDPETGIIDFADKEYAASRNNYEQIGGLRQLISDLIKKKLVRVEREK